MKLLYAEDEEAMSEAVTDILTFNKYIVDPVYDGADALDCARSGHYDGIILDIMMPKMDGVEVLSQLRREGCRTPVLLLTAKSDVEDKIRGLDAGADDYLPKPFETGELLARIRAMLRRREEFTPDILTFGNISLNMQTCELSGNGQSFVLPKLEYRLMEQLMLNKGIYLSSEELFVRAVFGERCKDGPAADPLKCSGPVGLEAHLLGGADEGQGIEFHAGRLSHFLVEEIRGKVANASPVGDAQIFCKNFIDLKLSHG